MSTIRMNDLPSQQTADGASLIAVNSQGEAVKIPSSAVGGGSSVAVVDNLNSNSSTSALSARQGKALNTRVTALEEGGGGGGSVTVVDNLNSDSATSALSAKQGKVLDTKIAGKANSSHTHTAGDVSGFANVATSGSYDDLNNKPSIPTVNNATITIKQQGVTKGSFTLNQSNDDEIDVGTGEETFFTAELLKKVLICRANNCVYMTSGFDPSPNITKFNGFGEPGTSSTNWVGYGTAPSSTAGSRLCIHNVNVDPWKGRKFRFTAGEGFSIAIASGTVSQTGGWNKPYPQVSDLAWNWHASDDPVEVTLGDMLAIMVKKTTGTFDMNSLYSSIWFTFDVEECEDSVKNPPRTLKDGRYAGYRIGVLGDSILAGASTSAYKTAVDVLVSDYGIIPVPNCQAGTCISLAAPDWSDRDPGRFVNRLNPTWRNLASGTNGTTTYGGSTWKDPDPFLGVLIFGVNDVLMAKKPLDKEPFIRVLTPHQSGGTQLEPTYDMQINTSALDSESYLSALLELESSVKSAGGSQLNHFYLVGPYMCTWPGNFPMNTLSKNPNGDTGEDFIRIQRGLCMIKGWSYMDLLSSQINTFLPGVAVDNLHPSQKGHQMLGDYLGQMLCGTVLTQASPIFEENSGESVDVVDNCDTDDGTKALSAKQGMLLKEEIDEISETMQEDESGYVKFVDEDGKIGLKLDREGVLEVKELAIVNEREEKLLILTRNTQLKKINIVPNILILGDSYSQQGTWITGMKKYINVGNIVNLAVGSATVKDQYADRETYPYTSRPISSSNTGNLNVFACQVEKLKRLMTGTDLDAGETQLYTSQEDYPHIIIIEGGQNDNVDTTEKENAYYSQFQKSVSNVYIKRKNNDTAELGSCAIPTPLDEVDRTSFAGAYRYLVEELNSLFPNAQIFLTTRSHLSYWNTTSVSAMYNIARQQRIVASILSAPLIDWNAVGFINTITDHVDGDGTQQNPYVWAEATMPHTGDLLHPNSQGGDVYGQVAANAILMNLLNL